MADLFRSVFSESDKKSFENFLSVRENGCIEWTSSVDLNGKGKFYCLINGIYSSFFVERVAYCLSKGDIKNGEIINANCGNPLCCNPEHLEKLSKYDYDKLKRNK